MCRNHHWIIDHDEETFTVDYLQRLKKDHIDSMRTQPSPSPQLEEIFEKEIPNLINMNIIYNKFQIGHNVQLKIQGNNQSTIVANKVLYVKNNSSLEVSERKVNQEFSIIITFLLKIINDYHNYIWIRKNVIILHSLDAFRISVRDKIEEIDILFQELGYQIHIKGYGGGGYDYYAQDNKFKNFNIQIPQIFHQFLEELRLSIFEGIKQKPAYPNDYQFINFSYQIKSEDSVLIGKLGRKGFETVDIPKIINYVITLMNLSKTPLIINDFTFVAKQNNSTFTKLLSEIHSKRNTVQTSKIRSLSNLCNIR